MAISHAADNSQYGRPGSPPNDPLRHLEQTSTAISAQWRRVVSADEEYRLRYTYTEDWAYSPYRQRVSFVTNRPPPLDSVTFFVSLDAGGKSRTHDLDFEHRLLISPGLRASWGAAAKAVSLYAPAQFSDHEWRERDNYRVFGNLEYQPNQKWLFNLGGSLEKDSLSNWLFDSRFGTSYHFDNENTLRLILSRAHRTPSLYEDAGKVQKVDPVSGLKSIEYFSQGVEPERIDTLEFGYLGEFKSLRASLDVRAFFEHIPNNVVIVPLALPVWMPDDQDRMVGRWRALTDPGMANTIYPFGRADSACNLENVRMSGYEYQLRWRPFESTRLMYSGALINIHATFNDVSVIADTTGDNTNKIIRQTRESAPHLSQSAMLLQELPYDFKASILYFQSGSMRWRRNGDAVASTERFDWRLAKSFRLGNTRGEIAYTVQMANASQQGRQSLRVADKVQWLSLGIGF